MFLDLLTKIVNISLKNGILLNNRKQLSFSHFKKINMEHIFCNYSLVSNLSFLSKLVNKADIVQLNIQNEYNYTTPQYQSAYKENYSCETSLLSICRSPRIKILGLWIDLFEHHVT